MRRTSFPTTLATAFATTLCAGICTDSATAQLEITEVLVDPVGPDSGFQIIELTNVSGTAFNPGAAGWHLLVPTASAPLGNFTVPAGASVQVHVNATGTDTANDWFTGTAGWRDLNSADTCLLFTSNQFQFLDDIADFVSWGGGTARMSDAMSAGQWNGGTVTLPTPEGHSIASLLVPFGNGAFNWFQDSTPTLGAANDGAFLGATSAPCTIRAVGPILHGFNQDLPWLGEPFELEIPNLVGPGEFAILGIGMAEPPQPLPLPPVFGFGRCYLYVDQITMVQPMPVVGVRAAQTFNLPLAPAAVGRVFTAQAFVSASVFNGFEMTNGLRGVAGLR